MDENKSKPRPESEPYSLDQGFQQRPGNNRFSTVKSSTGNSAESGRDRKGQNEESKKDREKSEK